MKTLVERTKKIRLGDILDPKTQMGSLISKAQVELVDKYVKAAIKDGARLLTGGEPCRTPPCDKGNYYLPTILEVDKNQMACVQEEIFGPVLVALKYKTIEQAIEMSNENQYALGASIYSENIRTLMYATKAVDAGIVWLNTNIMSKIEAPYGGNKNSGLGREDGVIGLKEYMKVKNNVLSLSTKIDSFYNF